MPWVNPKPPKPAVKISDLPPEYQKQAQEQLGTSKKKSTYKPAAISEDKLQEHCVNWFRSAYTRYTLSLYAIPNSGKRSIVTAVNMKRTGQLPGVWDLHLCIPRGKYAGMYIEMKVGKNDLTDNQKLFRDANMHTHLFVVCRTQPEFETAIAEYLAL